MNHIINILYKNILEEQLDYVHNLDDKQKKILFQYTKDDYALFNERLRTNISLSLFQNKMLDSLIDIYETVPLLKESITVYRGTKTDISKLNYNKTYISTSLNYQIAKERFAGKNCCLLQITVHPNTKILPLVEISDSPDEDEILLDKNGYIVYRGIQERDDMKIYLADYYDKEPISSVSETKEIESDIIVNRIFNILKRDKDDEDFYEIPDDEEIKQQYKKINKSSSIPKEILYKIKEMLENQ